MVKVIRSGWGAEVPVIPSVPLKTLCSIMDKARNFTWETVKGNVHIDRHPIFIGYDSEGYIDYIVVMTHTRNVIIDVQKNRIVEWTRQGERIYNCSSDEIGLIVIYFLKNLREAYRSIGMDVHFLTDRGSRK